MKTDTTTATVLNPNTWVDSYTHLLRNFARVRVSDAFMVEDLVQETFLSALKSKDNFKGNAKESTWLIAILRNKIVDHYRSMNSYKGTMRKNSLSTDAFIEKYNWDIIGTYEKENATISGIYENELKGIIKDGFKYLTIQEGKAMHLKMAGKSTQSICMALNVSKENFWVIIHRARKKLKRHIDTVWHNDL